MLTVEDRQLAMIRLGDLEEEYCCNPNNKDVWDELSSLRRVLQGVVSNDKK